MATQLQPMRSGVGMDLGIVIALKEEFREFMALLPVQPTPERDPATGQYGYVFEHPVSRRRCVVTLIGEMNPEPAALQTERLLSRWSPRAVVMLGIAAGIHPDVRVGDVVVASQVDNYLATAKAQGGSTLDSFEFSLGGTVFHADFNLLTQVRNFEFLAPQVFSRWQQDCVEGLAELVPEEAVSTTLLQKGLVRAAPDLLDAHLASDSVVAAAQHFTQWLRSKRDRNLKAIDMESAGFMEAAVKRMEPARTLIIRGISDYGDERKSDLDAVRDGALRRYAMCNATRLLWALLEAGELAESVESTIPNPSWRSLERGEHLEPGETVQSLAPAVSGQTPRYLDEETRLLSLKLEDARGRKERLQRIGVSTEAVDQEIRNLRRQMREGGRLRAGDSLGDGRFLLIDEVGRGGFGAVWNVVDRESGKNVAVKVLHTNLAGNIEKRERFFRGARRMAELQHPAVVQVVEQGGEDGGYCYFAMELVSGGDFRRAVLAKKMSPGEVISIVVRVGEALALAHSKGIVHRDVKPSNILLDMEQKPLLTDFDLVGAADTTGGTKTGMIGTVVYAAPECLDRPQTADARADVYSLGMTAVFGLYGAELPLGALRNMEKIFAALPCSQALVKVLKRATSWDVDERYSDAGGLVSALKYASEGLDRPESSSAAEVSKVTGALNTYQTVLHLLQQRVESIVLSSPSSEVTRTHGATALLKRWFTPQELDIQGFPIELREILALRATQGSEMPKSQAWTREGLNSVLRVTIVAMPEQEGERLWGVLLQELPQWVRVPSAWYERLTKREAAVVALVLQGCDNQTISKIIKCSLGTVKVHLQRSFDKLGVDSRAALIALAARAEDH